MKVKCTKKLTHGMRLCIPFLMIRTIRRHMFFYAMKMGAHIVMCIYIHVFLLQASTSYVCTLAVPYFLMTLLIKHIYKTYICMYTICILDCIVCKNERQKSCAESRFQEHFFCRISWIVAFDQCIV